MSANKFMQQNRAKQAAIAYANSPAGKAAAKVKADELAAIKNQVDLFAVGQSVINSIVEKYRNHPELFPRPDGWSPYVQDCFTSPFSAYFIDGWMPDGSDKIPPSLLQSYFFNHINIPANAITQHLANSYITLMAGKPGHQHAVTFTLQQLASRGRGAYGRAATQNIVRGWNMAIGHVSDSNIYLRKNPAQSYTETNGNFKMRSGISAIQPEWRCSFEQRIAYLELCKEDKLFWFKYWCKSEELEPYKAHLYQLYQNYRDANRGDDFDIFMGEILMPIVTIVVITIVTSGFATAGALSATAVTTVETATAIGATVGAVKTGTVGGALAGGAAGAQAGLEAAIVAQVITTGTNAIDQAIGQTPIGTPSEIFKSFSDIKNIRNSFLALRHGAGGAIVNQSAQPVAPAGYNPIADTVVTPVAPQAPAPANVPPHVTGAAIVGLGVLAKLFLLV